MNPQICVLNILLYKSKFLTIFYVRTKEVSLCFFRLRKFEVCFIDYVLFDAINLGLNLETKMDEEVINMTLCNMKLRKII